MLLFYYDMIKWIWIGIAGLCLKTICNIIKEISGNASSITIGVAAIWIHCKQFKIIQPQFQQPKMFLVSSVNEISVLSILLESD